MDHNQTITDIFLQKHLSIESRIIAAELYEAVKSELNPQLELAEYRLALKGWFEKELDQYESVKGRFGGIRLKSEENRIARPAGSVSFKSTTNSDSSIPSDNDGDEDDGLVVHITPSVRLTQPDNRNWAIQKRTGENMWVSLYYQNSLDAIIGSFIRHSLNGEFKASGEKISDLKELRKVILDTQKSLEESFKAVIVQGKVA